MEKLIEQFLHIGDGDGSGDGDGDGVKSFCGQIVYMVDGVSTLIDHVRDNIAKGKILNKDLTTTPCYVVKQENTFAHGGTLREAMVALRDKLFEDMPEEERIDEFVKAHAWDTAYKATDFFDWHNRLTGSCLAGRKAFAKDHAVDMNGSMTVKEFIALTKNAYGGDTIKRMAERYE